MIIFEVKVSFEEAGACRIVKCLTCIFREKWYEIITSYNKYLYKLVRNKSTHADQSESSIQQV